MFNLGNDICQRSVRLTPISYIPDDIRKGDVIYLEGHMENDPGIYICLGFNDQGKEMLFPMVSHKDIKRFIRKNS